MLHPGAMAFLLAPVIPPVDPITFGADIILTIIGGLFGGLFGGSDAGALNKGLTDLRQALADGLSKATRFAWSIAFAFGTLLQTLHDIWVRFLDAMWNLLKRIGAALEKLITEVLPKLLKLLHRLRELLQVIYKKYIRPLLNYIQIVRRYLAILRIFHVKWAAKLDGWLVNIQGRIIGPYLWVLRTLNGYGQWINVILTAGAVIQRPVFLRTMYAYQQDWVNLFWAGQATANGATSPPSGTPIASPPTMQQVRADLSTFVTTQSGPVANDAARAQAAALTVIPRQHLRGSA